MVLLSAAPEAEPEVTEPEGPSVAVEQHCGYFAVLPANLATAPAALEAACRALAAPTLGLRWLDVRPAELQHPALPEPLNYIEITCRVTVPPGGGRTAGEAALQEVAEALMAAAGTPVGNAELVHSLACPIPLLPTPLPSVRLPEDGAGGGAENKNCAGLAQIIGDVHASDRDAQSKHCACETHLEAWETEGQALFRRCGLVALMNVLPAKRLADVARAVVAQFDDALVALQASHGRQGHFMPTLFIVYGGSLMK
jgi:hypothetical protein